jgi:hypothetical protein
MSECARGYEGVERVHMTQDRNQWRAYEHGNEPSVSIKGEEFPNWAASQEGFCSWR